MKSVPIYVFLVVIYLTVDSNGEKYRFQKIQIIKSIALVSTKSHETAQDAYRGNHFSELKLDKRRKLCVAAQKSVAFSNIRKNDFYVLPAQLYEIETRREKGIFLVIRCPTLPTLYLRHLFQTYDIAIMMLESLADHYLFDVETAVSVSAVEGDRTDVQLQVHDLYALEFEQRWNFCQLAKTYIQNASLNVKDVVGKSKVYEFDYVTWKDQYVAIVCPSKPKMYLRLGNANTFGSGKMMKIVLVESELLEIETSHKNVAETDPDGTEK